MDVDKLSDAKLARIKLIVVSKLKSYFVVFVWPFSMYAEIGY